MAASQGRTRPPGPQHHARRPARTRADGSLVTLAEQDRSRWDSTLITEGGDVLQAALARDRLGEYLAQAAIAALHARLRGSEAPCRPADAAGARRLSDPSGSMAA